MSSSIYFPIKKDNYKQYIWIDNSIKMSCTDHDGTPTLKILSGFDRVKLPNSS